MLPSLASLVAFEAAARHLHFTRAGAELNVSQAAISRQMRLLEDDLGVKLFYRLPGGLELTAEGRRVYNVVNDGLLGMASICTEVRRTNRQSTVTVSASISASIYWLSRLISDFQLTNPDIDLRLVMTDPFVSPDLQNCDIAIRYGHGQWPKWKSHQMFGEEIIPICSPKFRESLTVAIASPEDLLQYPLLRLDMTDPGGLDWRTWFRALGKDLPTELSGPQFNNYAVMTEVARSGYGIGLGLRSLAQQLLDCEELCVAAPIGVRTNRAYFLTIPEHKIMGRAGKTVLDWLIEKARLSKIAMEKGYFSTIPTVDNEELNESKMTMR